MLECIKESWTIGNSINITAHELRIPILPIVGYSEILHEDIGEWKKIKGIIIMQKDLTS